MKNVCKRCQKEFEFVIPQSFCSPECKEVAEDKKYAKGVICVECGYNWTPKSLYPRACPRCKAVNWDGKQGSGQVKDKETTTCMKCGKEKYREVAVCPYCKTIRSELGHWCGITLTQKDTMQRFLKAYQGEDSSILEFKKAYERVEVEKEGLLKEKDIEQGQTSKVIEQKELCIDAEDNIDNQLKLLEKTLEIAPIPKPAEIEDLLRVGE